ncbi:MAG: methylenetetrahydrofolate reductase, partial [Nanoarchaeota archaeon]|nr:methylenetetrahydrofolate reductase [Nanoarchaeota archaeon]
MRVTDIIKEKKGKAISVEIEPPSVDEGIERVYDILDPLVNVKIGIDYINITNHTERIQENEDGSLSFQIERPGTIGVAGAIKEKYREEGTVPVPHVICTGFTKHDIERTLIDLNYLGIKNIMALRGDPRKLNGKFAEFKPEKEGYSYARDLIKQIADLKEGKYLEGVEGEPIDFCIGAACYPEGYYKLQAPDENIDWTKAKVKAGAGYLTTQLFFDNRVYSDFLDNARKAGIDVPIIPGIFPISMYGHLEKLPEVFGCAIPNKLAEEIEKYKDSEDDIRKAGIEWCVEQCLGLRENGAQSLHLFTNRSAP